MIKQKMKLRSKTNEGLKAKIKICLCQEKDETAIIVNKLCFSSTPKQLTTKRKVRELYFNEEFIVLKFDTFLAIAEEIIKFKEKQQ